MSLTLALLATMVLAPQQGATPARDTCIAYVNQNLAKGNGNFFSYFQISDQRITVQPGDTLVYSVLLDPKGPIAKGSVDIDFVDDGNPLRDSGLDDQNGIRAHGDGLLTPAVGKWYTRRIGLDAQQGRTTRSWTLAFEGDLNGRYAMFVDDVYIERKDGTKVFVYQNGEPPLHVVDNVSGYSTKPTCVSIDKSSVVENANLDDLIAKIDLKGERMRALEEVRKDIDVAKRYLERNPDPALEMHLKDAVRLLEAAEQKDSTPDEIQAVLHSTQHALSHMHPIMEKYTGHLVGHAHIDLQWLWEWQEGIVFSHDTFNQAVKFMDEFPGFTFSQSSSAIYQTIEEHYPELFKKIQEKVKKGQWEIVGGRVCEGDTNMLSPESHARHFLYGQRYFREKFGKTAIVGWEPDTFGHTAQMPQILQLGGCKYYYFCRGGKDKPLFNWKGLDGTEVLAFDEPATGTWYNSDLSYKQFQELLDFETATGGAKDTLWVYGVGNHGGGPTREHIETALGWMKDPTKPNVKFSTATQFFKKLETYNLSKIPTITGELNPVFDGCYTTHSEIKQLNRDSEALTTSAEAIATVASLNGFKYPKETFRKNWEDICFNHHHDTLPGSGIHAPYDRTKVELGRVIADDKDIITRAFESMAIRVTPKQGGISTMVFNPTGWSRGGWVETYLVKSGWDGGESTDLDKVVATGPDGKDYPVEVVDAPSKRVRFWAGGVPAFGYSVFHLHNGAPTKRPVEVRDGGYTAENSKYVVEFDQHDGCISRLYDKVNNRELAAKGAGLGRLEIHWENPEGMSAWVIGKIAKVDTLAPVSSTTHTGPDYAEVTFTYKLPAYNNPGKDTTIQQTFRLSSGSDEVTVNVDCDWQAIGTGQTKNPTLRVAFDTAFANPTATYEIPFGAITRPTDGREFPALEWADLGDKDSGLSIVNDSKYGHSASGNTMRMTLIRSSFEPDPVPNPGLHHWKYAIVPHKGDWRASHMNQRAAEFNQPLMGATVPFDARGDAPLTYSPLNISGTQVVPTALKRGEDAGDLILRMYEGTGAGYNGQISLNTPVNAARWVNFVEDDLGKADLNGNRVPLALHGFEIRTVKFRPIPMAGSRR